MPLTKLDVKGIKDGTDRQIITWDSSAVSTTTGPGTANQVLTSNGAGAEPSFKEVVSTSPSNLS